MLATAVDSGRRDCVLSAASSFGTRILAWPVNNRFSAPTSESVLFRIKRAVPRRVCVVITARASYSRIRAALAAMDADPRLDLQLIVAASGVLDRYGDVASHIEADGFQVAGKIFNLLEGESPLTNAKSTGLQLIELSSVFDSMRPDMVVTIADRFETLSTSVAAAYLNLPLVHIQGGEVTGSIDEKVRHANTKLSDIHLVATEQAGDYVRRMGESADRVFVTGCPSLDLAAEVAGQSEPFTVDLSGHGVGVDIDLHDDFVIVLQHPVTTQHEAAGHQIEQTLQAVKEVGKPVVWFWPNPDAGTDRVSGGIRRFREANPGLPIRFVKHLDSMDFLRLAKLSRCLIGNSSVAIREASFLGVPAVNIGDRQSDRERGRNVIDVPHDSDAITAAIRTQLAHGPYPADTLYGDGDSGHRIADVLATVKLSHEKKLSYLDQMSDSDALAKVA